MERFGFLIIGIIIIQFNILLQRIQELQAVLGACAAACPIPHYYLLVFRIELEQLAMREILSKYVFKEFEKSILCC